MRQKRISTTTNARSKGERGAALITMLMVATLLLMAGGALILTSSLSATNAIDTTAEIQAYYAAEAGLQDTLNVLRGNIASHKSSSTPINLKNAADPNISNDNSDPWGTATDSVPRLSAWLNYTYKNGDDWRVPLSTNYSPMNGIAYTIKIVAPKEDGPPTPGKPSKDDHFQKPNPAPNPKPTPPAWHTFHCGHCQWDYSHHPFCNHHHCLVLNGVWVADNWEYSSLYIESTGYGPRGAVKKLEMTVARTDLDMKAAGMITMIGADDGSTPHLNFGSGGQDNQFKGQDASNETDLAAFALSQSDYTWANDNNGPITKDDPKNIVAPRSTIISSTNTPSFLQSADTARQRVTDLMYAAQAYGGYYTTYNGAVGTATNPDYVFVDGDATLTGGAGLIVVTGTLSLNLTSDFKGLILVLGGGKVTTTSSSAHNLRGLIFIAKFDLTWPSSQNNQPHPFQSPWFDNTGNGKIMFQFDSAAAMTALDQLPHAVTGVVER